MTKAETTAKRQEIYFCFRPKVLAYALGHVKNQADAEDIAQEVFLKVYKNLDKFDETRASLSTWIYAITRNQVISYFRARKQNVPLDEEILDEKQYALNNNNDLQLACLADALEQLPQKQRDTVILHYCYGYSHAEIAQKMNLSYDNVRKICSLAISALKEKLKK